MALSRVKEGKGGRVSVGVVGFESVFITSPVRWFGLVSDVLLRVKEGSKANVRGANILLVS
jgi:hypothetical protein